jgi:hypothetical protein
MGVDLNELALFAGVGGGILGGKLLGWNTVCAVERDAYAAAVLAQRQNDGVLEPFPIWSDVTTFDGRPWRGIVDVVSGGFPCQDISSQGGAMDSTGNVPASGQKWSGSFAKYDRILCLWKTHQCSLLGDWEPFSETWPRWGFMLNGECWERTMLVALTKDTASGLLPTPMATDWKGGTASIRKDTGKQRLDQFRDWCKSLHGLTYPIPGHSEAVMMWPVGWSDLKPLAMDKFRQWRQRHSGF